MKALILAMLVGALLSGGLGVGYARFAKPPAAAAKPAEKHDAKVETKHAKSGDDAKDKKEDPAAVRNGAVALAPVVANLAAPDGVWVRIEGAMVVEGVEEKSLEQLKREVAADMLAYLTTVSLPQIQGALGLQHVREDIEDRMAIRSKGKAREFVIYTMVVQ